MSVYFCACPVECHTVTPLKVAFIWGESACPMQCFFFSISSGWQIFIHYSRFDTEFSSFAKLAVLIYTLFGVSLKQHINSSIVVGSVRKQQ
jgi:hypothetical protein